MPLISRLVRKHKLGSVSLFIFFLKNRYAKRFTRLKASPGNAFVEATLQMAFASAHCFIPT